MSDNKKKDIEMMETLYNVDVRTISEHIKKIYNDGELDEASTIRKFRIVQTEGKRLKKEHTMKAILTAFLNWNRRRRVNKMS